MEPENWQLPYRLLLASGLIAFVFWLLNRAFSDDD